MPRSHNGENDAPHDKPRDNSHDNRDPSRDSQIERKTGPKTRSPGKSRDLARSTKDKRRRAIMNLSNQERQLSDENIAAIQYCKVELGLSNEQIHRVSGHSLASISKYTSGLVSKVREQTPDPPSTNGNERIEASTSAKEATNGSEYQPPESRNGEDVLPRKSYQITAPRPVIVEGGNGKESGDRQYEESRVVVRGPYMSNTVPDTLERIFSYSALTAGYTNVGDYVAEQILPDIKTLS